MVTIVTSAVNLDVKLDGSQQSTLKLDGGQIKNPTKMNYKNNWLATQIIFAYRCFKYFYVSVLVHVSFFVESICFMKNYIILHYALDSKYGDHSLFTGVFVTNYAN